MKAHNFKWHQLDPDVGGYMTCRIGSGHDLIILSTPISTGSQAEHRKALENKIEDLNDKIN